MKKIGIVTYWDTRDNYGTVLQNYALCEKYCPVNFNFEKPKFNNTYAMILKDDASLQNSTSGGVFYGFAKKILEDGGVVFGAKLCDDFS